jgi:hypothetical protein
MPARPYDKMVDFAGESARPKGVRLPALAGSHGTTVCPPKPTTVLPVAIMFGLFWALYHVWVQDVGLCPPFTQQAETGAISGTLASDNKLLRVVAKCQSGRPAWTIQAVSARVGVTVPDAQSSVADLGRVARLIRRDAAAPRADLVWISAGPTADGQTRVLDSGTHWGCSQRTIDGCEALVELAGHCGFHPPTSVVSRLFSPRPQEASREPAV